MGIAIGDASGTASKVVAFDMPQGAAAGIPV